MPHISAAVRSSTLVRCFGWLTIAPATMALAEPFEQIVNVNASVDCSVDGTRSDKVQLPAGFFEFEPVGPAEGGSYTAVNPWAGVVEDCEPDGTNCWRGWRWELAYSIAGGPTEFIECQGTFETPELALEAAIPIHVQVDTPSELRLWYKDSICGDNRGGVSVKIRVATQTPTEHSSWSRIKGLFR